MSGYNVDLLRGEQISLYTEALARLRIEVFREFPYLYDGDFEYEAKYLKTLSESSKSLVVLVTHHDEVVGASTALPLLDADEPFQEPFQEPERYFYFGESVLNREHRGNGLGKAFFHHREAVARDEGFERTCFCAVVRPDDHPRRPEGYRDLTGFWLSQGYQALDQTTTYPWKDLGDDRETEKVMKFWAKDLI